jgi:hypothetical protein
MRALSMNSVMRRSILAAMLLAICLAAAVLVPGAVRAGSGDPVRAAALRTAHVGSARIAFSASVEGGGFALAMTGTGLQSGQAARMHFRYRSGVFAGVADPSMDVVSRVERGSLVVYLRIGFLQSQLPRGKRWVRIDLVREGKKLGLDLGKLMGGPGFNPTGQWALLRFGRSTHKISVERVRGRPTSHYLVTVDLEQAARADPQLAATLKTLEAQTGERLMVMDAWVDGQGYLRRIRQDYRYLDPTTRLWLSTAMTIDYVGFGAPVTISAPPAREVVDSSTLPR